MKKLPQLSRNQEKRAKKLTKLLKLASRKQDYEGAVAAYSDLSSLLGPYGRTTRLMKARNHLFRAAIDANELTDVEQGLKIVVDRLKSTTRGWLESHSLLAIFYLKIQRFEKSKEHIFIALKNEAVISSESKQKEFHQLFIDRLEEEALLVTLKNKGTDLITPAEIEERARILLQSNASEDDIAETLGRAAPPETVKLLSQIDALVQQRLPYRAPLGLPDPTSKAGKISIGKKLFKALKRRTYLALCDPKSDVNQAMMKGGLQALVGGSSLLTTAISTEFVNAKVAIGTLAVGFSALILKVGLEATCDTIKQEADFLT